MSIGIRIRKTWKELSWPKPHETDRRDFLKHSALAGAATVLFPSALKNILGSSEVQAAETIQENFVPAPVVLELVGGAGLTRIFGAVNERGELLDYSGMSPLEDLRVLGVHRFDEFDSNLIQGLHINKSDPFYATLTNPNTFGCSQALLQQVLDKCSGALVSFQNGDDTRMNPEHPFRILQNLRKGEIFNSSVGKPNLSSNDLGNRSCGISIAWGTSDLIKLASFGNSNRRLPGSAGGINLATDAALQMLDSQSQKFQRREAGELLFQKIKESLSQNKKFSNSNFGSTYLNPAVDTRLTTNSADWNYGNFVANGRENIISLYRVALLGFSSGVNFYSTGYDYHETNPPSLIVEKHQELAQNIGMFVLTAHKLQRPGFLWIMTDGSVGFVFENENSNLKTYTMRAPGDRGQGHVGVCITYHPSGPVAMDQLGHFDVTNSGSHAASTDTVIGESRTNTRNAAAAMLLNYAYFTQTMSQSEGKISPSQVYEQVRSFLTVEKLNRLKMLG